MSDPFGLRKENPDRNSIVWGPRIQDKELLRAATSSGAGFGGLFEATVFSATLDQRFAVITEPSEGGTTGRLQNFTSQALRVGDRVLCGYLLDGVTAVIVGVIDGFYEFSGEGVLVSNATIISRRPYLVDGENVLGYGPGTLVTTGPTNTQAQYFAPNSTSGLPFGLSFTNRTVEGLELFDGRLWAANGASYWNGTTWVKVGDPVFVNNSLYYNFLVKTSSELWVISKYPQGNLVISAGSTTPQSAQFGQNTGSGTPQTGTSSNNVYAAGNYNYVWVLNEGVIGVDEALWFKPADLTTNFVRASGTQLNDNFPVFAVDDVGNAWKINKANNSSPTVLAVFAPVPQAQQTPTYITIPNEDGGGFDAKEVYCVDGIIYLAGSYSSALLGATGTTTPVIVKYEASSFDLVWVGVDHPDGTVTRLRESNHVPGNVEFIVEQTIYSMPL